MFSEFKYNIDLAGAPPSAGALPAPNLAPVMRSIVSCVVQTVA